MTYDAPHIAQVLSDNFGFDGFRTGQQEVVESVLSGRDTMVVMPTGSGKSLCYQLPALVKNGVTLVISPLIALMQDQVAALCARNIAATYINSTLSPEEQRQRIHAISQGLYKLVYIAPERFRSQYFVETLRAVRPALVAVDEAHCISQWGHDFRPDYLRLKQGVATLGRPQIVALTATATPYVRADIAQQLGLEQPATFVSGFDRPNLFLHIAQVPSEAAKIFHIKHLVNTYQQGSGIVYAATRKAVELVTAELQAAGISAIGYHAGLSDDARSYAQNAFMSGRKAVIVATNAFGMGIDKPDIRFVAHFQLPGSIEAYYQEIGRAGRDGAPATCTLLFNYADKRTHEFFIDGSYPPLDTIREVYRALAALRSPRIELSAKEIAQRAGIKNEMAVYSSLIILEKAGHIERGATAENCAALRLLVTPPEARLRAGTRDTQARQLLYLLLEQHGLTAQRENDINLHEVAQATGLDLAAVRRAITSLAAGQILSYTPARRTRGITLLDEKPARKLNVDATELDNRAALERRKLKEIISLCYAEQCFRHYLLDYFGDAERHPRCHQCSHCTPGAVSDTRLATQSATASERARNIKQTSERTRESQSEFVTVTPSIAPSSRLGDAVPRALTADETLVARKILAGAARMQGRFGKHLLAAMMRGAREKKLLEAGLDRLSTYGLLGNWTQEKLLIFIDALIAAGCLRMTLGQYATVHITDLGEQVMREQAVTDVPWPVATVADTSVKEKSATKTSKMTLTHQETYQLYERGLSLEEIAVARSLAVSTVEGHLVTCVRAGQPLDINRFVSAADRALIVAASATLAPDEPRPLSALRAILPEHITYSMMRLVHATTQERLETSLAASD